MFLSNKLFMLMAIIALSLNFTSCKEEEEAINCDTYEWGYEGSSAADTWSVCTAECGGSSQSPVNISGADVNSALSAIKVDYKATTVNVTNTGHGLKQSYKNDSKITVDGKEFKLLQFHFHNSSEHTVDGRSFPMEVHFVHQSEDGKLAVIGVFFKEGAENATLNKLMAELPAEKGTSVSSTASFIGTDLMPASKSYYTYSGSLTTPPCSEIVTWLVMEQNIEASKAQIEKMLEFSKINNRPVQALNGRTISKYQG